jgi:hypothetical protein
VQQKGKLGSEAQFRKPRRARDVSCRVKTRRASEEEEEEHACGTSLLTHLPTDLVSPNLKGESNPKAR